MNILSANQQTIEQAAQKILDGHLVGVPTETVYGLAADATNDLAVAKIFVTKGRPQFNPLIVHVNSIQQAEKFVEFTPLGLLLAETFWPGPLTLVLPRKKDVSISYLVSAGLDTIAIRCPAHEVMRELISVSRKPIAAPSANPSNCISPTTAKHVLDGFKGLAEPAVILDGGPCSVGLESTIINACSSLAIILRPGGLSFEVIENVCAVKNVEPQSQITAPGMMAKHYAPKHKIRLNAQDIMPTEVLLAFGPDAIEGGQFSLNLSLTENMLEAASNLFAMLHQLDAIDSDGIAVMRIPDTSLGVAINDRLKRAAQEINEI